MLVLSISVRSAVNVVMAEVIILVGSTLATVFFMRGSRCLV